MFTYKTEIKWHHCDAAGVLFFAHQFTLIHDAYQALMQSLDLPLLGFISEFNYTLPIVHAEADYQVPLTTGDKIKIIITVEKIGKSSFILTYTLFNINKTKTGTAKTVHVSIDKHKKKKINLPVTLVSALYKHCA
jgi:YbgC/YbaW family acyl-CoA thioester hydrolase